MINIRLVIKRDTIFINMNGELDQHNTDELKIKITELMDKYSTKNIVFNMEKLYFMDSSGIGLLLGRFNQVKKLGGEIILCSLNDNIKKIVMVSGIYKICIIKEDEMTASHYLGVA